MNWTNLKPSWDVSIRISPKCIYPYRQKLKPHWFIMHFFEEKLGNIQHSGKEKGELIWTITMNARVKRPSCALTLTLNVFIWWLRSVVCFFDFDVSTIHIQHTILVITYIVCAHRLFILEPWSWKISIQMSIKNRTIEKVLQLIGMMQLMIHSMNEKYSVI